MSEHIHAFLSEWTAAERVGDTERLEPLLADDFCGVGPLGFVLILAMIVVPPLVAVTWWFRVRSDRAYKKARDRVAAVEAEQGVGTLAQPRAEQLMLEVGAGFGEREDRVGAGGRAAAQPRDLREDEPHPVAGLAAAPQLRQRPLVGAAVLLRDDKPF